ncbi:hypothetical protein [Haliea sp. E17]|uniref:hypothetical protein n=1 Tax=Haliea sp. E17 TaxID=3401576 RepID=UPI003AABF9E5
MIKARLAALCFAAASIFSAGAQAQCDTPDNAFTNCGFETGDFSGWTVTDIAGSPHPLTVVFENYYVAGFLFGTQPTEGTQVAVLAFDGDGPGTSELAQDVTLGASATTLTFDYRYGFEFDESGGGTTVPRTASVEIQPAGGGAPLATTTFAATGIDGDLLLDSGPLSAAIDVSAFAGQSVRVVFVWTVPESFTGPAVFQLDNIQALGVTTPPPAPPPAPLPAAAADPEAIPASPLWSLLLLAGVMGALSQRSLRSRARR